MEKLIGEYSYVQIPKDATDIQLHKVRGIDNHCITLFARETDEGTQRIYLNKPGNYELIGISSEITEEQAQGIVEEIFSFGRVRRWKDYQYPDSGLYSALDSFKILLASKGLKGRYAILKTIK